MVAWDLTKTSPQTLAFTNIKLDLGDYITKVAGPAVLEIQQYTKPFQEIVRRPPRADPRPRSASGLQRSQRRAALAGFGANTSSLGTLINVINTVNTLATAINGLEMDSGQLAIGLPDFDLNASVVMSGPRALKPSALASNPTAR